MKIRMLPSRLCETYGLIINLMKKKERGPIIQKLKQRSQFMKFIKIHFSFCEVQKSILPKKKVQKSIVLILYVPFS